MTPQQQAQDIADLIGARLGISGQDLETKVKKAGRLLPRRIRQGAETLAQSAAFAGHPKLARMIDPQAQRAAYRDCKKFLEQIDGSERVIRFTLGLVTANAFNFLAISSALIAVLVWRGFL